MMKTTLLALAVSSALYLPAQAVFAQTQTDQSTANRNSVTTTSNSTKSNATKRVRQLDAVQVSGQLESLGGGNMEYQDATKEVSTIGREAILKAAPGANFTQMLASIPGAISATNDVTGLNDGNFTVRGFPPDEVGVTVNGVPINDSGNYKMYATEYGDTENMGDITVEQGFPDVTSPVIGAAGGNIAWVTVNPSHKAGLDFSQSLGSNAYRRTFLRYNTGDVGPVRSWISYSNNRTDLWRGAGKSKVTKVDAKSVWTINSKNSVTASVQYNREVKNNFRNLTKAQIAEHGYHYGYLTQSQSSNPGDWYTTANNPFRSWIASLDGEFTLSDSLHLSVVPYFVYGYGGGSYGYSHTYVFFTSDTYRPGIHIKFKKDFGLNDSLEFGALVERPRQQGSNVYLPASIDGYPADLWGHDSAYYSKNANGTPKVAYRFYSVTPTRRVFATNTWTPNDKWTVTLGGAYTWVERKGWYSTWPESGKGINLTSASSSELFAAGHRDYHKFTPDAGVKFQLDEKNQFYLGVGQSYRAPINTSALYDIWNAAYAQASGKTVSSGNADPEQAWTTDLGWRFYGDKVSAVIDAYATNFKNKQFSGSDPQTSAPVYYSLGNVHMRGLDAELSYKFNDNWNAYVSYAYTKATMETNVTLGSATYATKGKTMVNTPKNSGYVALNYNQGPFWATLSANMQSSIWGTFENYAGSASGGFTVINLNGGWNFADAGWLKKPYVKVNLFNLANRKALSYSSTTSLSSSASSASWQLLQDRTVMVTFGASFGL